MKMISVADFFVQSETEAWDRFISYGRITDNDVVKPEILQSWERCYRTGIDYFDGTSHLVLQKHELEQLRSSYINLIEAARHYMLMLHEFVSGSGFIVFLADKDGFILESMGDYDIMDKASEVNLVTGTGWMEEEVGTNGIGTALKLKKPVQVSGKEHYCKKLHTWTCSASPIFDNYGQIIGALQMSGPSRFAHLHTLGIIETAVEAISGQMRIKKQARKINILNDSLQNLFQNMSDGALIIDRQGTIRQINPVGKRIIGYNIIGKSINHIFKDDQGRHGLEDNREYDTDFELTVINSNNRLHYRATRKPIRDENGDITGAVILFNPINKIKKLDRQFSANPAHYHFEDIIGNSPKLLSVIRAATRAASNCSNVLIAGESGTGKELFAQAIHNFSSCQDGPFVALNCAAIPRELIASELFGYVEGAFTGARRGGKPGKFEMASGGTLFLDEIGDMPLDQQVALLRVLQEKTITRIGDEKVIPIDVRVICATNKDLKKEVEKGNFREDLYYRINVILLYLPPLRDRKEDISILFESLLNKVSAKIDASVNYVQPEIIECLQSYNWPGNVRELENVVEKLMSSMENGALYLEQLPDEITGIQPSDLQLSALAPISSKLPDLEDGGKDMNHLLIERNTLVDLLAAYNGNISRVAKEMDVSRNTVYRKIRFYAIDRACSFK